MREIGAHANGMGNGRGRNDGGRIGGLRILFLRQHPQFRRQHLIDTLTGLVLAPDLDRTMQQHDFVT